MAKRKRIQQNIKGEKAIKGAIQRLKEAKEMKFRRWEDSWTKCPTQIQNNKKKN